jgi:hypothetical protein
MHRVLGFIVKSLDWWPWAQSWVAWAADGLLTHLEGRKR